MSKVVLFQTVQFSIITQFSSIWPIDRTLSGDTTPSQSGPGSDGNEGVLNIPQSSSITGDSPSDCLVTFRTLVKGVLPLYREAVHVFYSPNRLDKGRAGCWFELNLNIHETIFWLESNFMSIKPFLYVHLSFCAVVYNHWYYFSIHTYWLLVGAWNSFRTIVNG